MTTDEILAANLEALRELTKEVSDLKNGGGGGSGRRPWYDVRSPVWASLVGALLIGAYAWVWNIDRTVASAEKDIQFNTREIHRVDDKPVPHPDVLRRLQALEDWRDRHTENGG